MSTTSSREIAAAAEEGTLDQDLLNRAARDHDLEIVGPWTED